MYWTEVTIDGLSKESEGNHRGWSYLSVRRFCFLIFNVWNVAIFPICGKLLTVSHPTCIAGSKQHIGNPNSEVNTCIGIYL